MRRWGALAASGLVVVALGCAKTDSASTTTTAAVQATAARPTTTKAVKGDPSSGDPSSGEAPSTTGGRQATTTTPAGGGRTSTTFNGTDCLAITSASLDLLVATTAEDAGKAMITIKGYNPPDAVQKAAEHFVVTKGGQVTDPDFSANNALLENWVHAVCPSAASTTDSSLPG
jgi:hypothetical protein